MPSPLDFPDPFNAAPTQRPAPQLPPISPEDERSLLGKIGSGLMGGLGWLGGILNKPGRVIRGALGGHFDELGNVIPFSDALGITDPEREVRGQDLIGADKDTPFFSPQGIAGFGVDVLTDPLTYMSFGGSALTKLGKAAEAAHVLPGSVAGRLAGVSGDAAEKLAAKVGSTSAEVAGQRLGGHVGIGLPFGDNAATFDLGPLGRAIKGGARTAAGYVPGGNALLDAGGAVANAAGNMYTSTIPPLFQSAVLGRKTKIGQDVAREITSGTPEAIARANAEAMPLAQLAVQHGLDTPAGAAAIRHAGETGVGVTPDIASILKPMQESLAGSIQEQMAHGLPAHELAPQEIRQGVGEGQNLGYLPRQSVQPDKSMLDYLKSKTIKPVEGAARKDWTTGLTTESLNKMATENLGIAGTTMNPLQQIEKSIGEKYLNIPKQQAEVNRIQDLIYDDMAAHQRVVTDQSLIGHLKDAQAVQSALEHQARELAKMKLDGTLPQFLEHPVADFAKKKVQDNINLLKATASYGGLAKAVVPAGEGTVPIMEALGKLWKPQDYLSAAADAPTGAQMAMQSALDKLGIKGKLADLHVSGSVAEDLAGLSKMHTFDGLQQFTKVWDSLTNLTKAGQTMFPSTVVRNVVQDVFNKIVYGMHDPSFSALDPRRFIQPLIDWKKIANGGTVDGLAEKMQKVSVFKGLDDAQAAAKMRELYTTWDVGHEGVKKAAVDLGSELGGHARQGINALLPVTEQKGPLAAYVGGLKGGDLNPLHVAGFLGQKETAFKPVLAKQAADSASDSLTRGSSFMAKMMQGFEPEAAFQATVKAHYDYANMSQFEKGFMRRLVPFYSWSRQNIPAVAQEIAELPGGKLATAVKASVAARGADPGFMRPDLASGFAMPLGSEDSNGQQKFLSRLGLGFEDIGQIAGPSDALGMLNPLLKAPLEAWSGKQFATGRDLADLHSRIGDLTGVPMPATENLMMNSPVGRLLTSAGTLTDDRKSVGDKALNLLTGARVQDVDVEGARRQAVRQYVQDNLHGPAISHFDELSVRPDNLPLLTPEQRRLYQLYRLMQTKKPL